MDKVELIKKKFNHVRVALDKPAIRVWCASESKSLGYAGITAVHRAR